MNKKEISGLFKRIKNHYDVFSVSEDKIEEWYRFLKDYDAEDVYKSLDNYLSNDYDNPPLVYHLTRGLRKVEVPEESCWITECDICKKRITIYNNDMTDYEKHRRRCAKIDFIDTMSKRLRGEGVAICKYYEMSDDELEKAYRKIMNYYLQTRDEEKPAYKPIPDEF